MGGEPESRCRHRAKVIGCLRSGFVTIVLGHGLGLSDGGIATDIPIDLVPFDLRTPNSVFAVVLDPGSGRVVRVER